MSRVGQKQPAQDQRAGNVLSSKQLAYAAFHGRLVTFRFAPDGSMAETGYVVGMDDFHVMVAVPDPEAKDAHVRLVHKGSAPIIDLHAASTLDDELPAVRIKIENIGRAFWARCARLYAIDPQDSERESHPTRLAATGPQGARKLTPVVPEGALVS